MIIVEGSDHVGKTTFCKKLVDEMKRQGVDSKYEHMSRPKSDFDYFGDYMTQLHGGQVYDRFHYGAYVYGAMLRLHPTEGFTLQSMRLVSRFIHLRGGMIVLIHDSDLKKYSLRLEDGKEEMFKLRDIEFANKIFSRIPLIDELDMVMDINGGETWPSEGDATQIVTEWRKRNGL